MIHAPDPVGKAALKAALMVCRMERMLLMASSPEASREVRKDACVRFFTDWPGFARAVSALEQSAPHAAREGLEKAARMADVIEGSAQER